MSMHSPTVRAGRRNRTNRSTTVSSAAESGEPAANVGVLPAFARGMPNRLAKRRLQKAVLHRIRGQTGRVSVNAKPGAQDDALRAAADTLFRAFAALSSEAQHSAAQKLVDNTSIRRLDPLAESLQKRTVEAVLTGASWLTSKEVGLRADPDAANKHSLASRLLKDQRVFAIERAGHKEFPDYAFDPLGNPLPALREVLRILAGYSPFRLASWFESRSSLLGGHRPRELLANDPDAVIEAARAHIAGPVHG